MVRVEIIYSVRGDMLLLHPGGVGGWMFCSPEAVGWVLYEGCPLYAGGLGTSTATMSRLRALSSNEDELSKECPK